MVTRPKLRLARYLVPVIIVLAIIFSIRQCGNQEKPSGHPRDYAAIAKEGILRVATEYNSISFYVDGDTVSGFHYELIQAFAHDKGLKTEITPLMSFEERLEGLSEGRYDVIACGILATSELKDSLLLTSPITLNKQVLVQRKENGENDSLYIRNQLDLAGRTLHVVKGSPSILRIQNLGNEIGDTIYINGKVLKEHYGLEPMVFGGIAEKPIKLGKDEFFVLGDNRNDSIDSRDGESVGVVKRKNIDGHAILRIYPFSRVGKITHEQQRVR